MHLAFYRYSKSDSIFKTFIDRIICWWTCGPYSHVEIVWSLDFEKMIGISSSSSPRDGGVRTKEIYFDSDKWTFVEICGNELKAKEWFLEHSGEKYDFTAILGYLWRPLNKHNNKWICSESICEAFGANDSWRYDPNLLFNLISKFLLFLLRVSFRYHFD